MADERVMTEDEIETMARDLEAKMMEIRKDPHAALIAGLTKIRATLLAEMEADRVKLGAKMEAAAARFEVEYEAKLCAKMEVAEAKLRAKMEAVEAKIEPEYSSLMTELRAERLRYRQLNAAEAAEPDSCARQ
jgi:hypothetical protein